MPTNTRNLPPLAVKCTQSDCENGLHCFKKTRRMTSNQIGQCRACGAELIDWERIHRREIGDASFTFQALKNEWIRHYLWHVPIDGVASRHARRKGYQGLETAAEIRLRSSVGVAQPFRDGQQTPFEGNVLYYAQHALACCCRACLEYWHGIPKGTVLDPDEIDYFVQLIMMFVKERLPDLTDEGESVPRRRGRASAIDRPQLALPEA